MEIALNLLEEWGLYTLAGVISIYFVWHILGFLQAQHVSFRNDPILTITTLGWGSIWIVGNGVGNAFFIFTIVGLIGDIVRYHTNTPALPTIPGSEAVVFLLGLMPSLYQFRYQADPDYLESLPLSRRLVAISLTIADGVFCAVGWYWWLLPPVYLQGQFDFPFDQTLLVGGLAWGIFASYIAQFMTHMQLFDLLGITPPTFPNPFVALWHSLRASQEDEVTANTATAHRKKQMQRRRHSARPTLEPTSDVQERSFEEWEPQP